MFEIEDASELAGFGRAQVGDIDDHVVVDVRAVVAAEAALGAPSVVRIDPRIGRARPAAAIAPVAEQGISDRSERSRQRLKGIHTRRTVVAHGYPRTQKLRALEIEAAALPTHGAARTEAHRPRARPPHITAPAATATKLADTGVADVAMTHTSLLRPHPGNGQLFCYLVGVAVNEPWVP